MKAEKMNMQSTIILLGLFMNGLALAESPSRASPRDAGHGGIDRYNVIWESPSEDSGGSMPIGNGDIGLNAWVEKTGDLVFYLSKTDAWDENHRLCKIGKVRVTFDPPLATNGFCQKLKLREGVIEIQAGEGDAASLLRLWVDAQQPVVRLDVQSERPVQCRAGIELWRTQERPFGKNDDEWSGRGLSEHSSKPVVLADVVGPQSGPRVVWYHRNTRSVYPISLDIQHLESLKGEFPDPLLNHTFGAGLSGTEMNGDGPLALKSVAPAKRHSLMLTVLAERTETPEAWLARLAQLEAAARKTDVEASRRNTAAWWDGFWNRSWIWVEPSGNPEAAAKGAANPQAKALDTLMRGYVLQRYMTACAGRGGSPIKFNGSIFTVEMKPGENRAGVENDPDWRRWGGSYWFQNTRLSYWPMLASGDGEMLEPWFRMYLQALPLSKAKVAAYYKLADAAVFPETMYLFGLPNNGDFGFNNKGTEPANTYIKRYWSGGLELIAVMLERYDFTRDPAFARETLVPLAAPLIAFFDQYWQKRDADGKRVFEPSQSLETFQHGVVNPLPEIAGLRFLLPRLLALPETVTTEAQRTAWKRFLDELPPVPVAEVEGIRLLRAAEKFGSPSNAENPELYAVFPFRLYGVGKPDLELARTSYSKRAKRINNCWCQDSIQAACLGLGEEAGNLVLARANTKNNRYRFPAMWGPHFDWVPDQDHGGNIMTTLQFMLMQWDPPTLGSYGAASKIYLLPAWPKDWDVRFKLHAPQQTTVEGVYRSGKMEELKVTPESRRKDIVLNEK